MWNFLSFIWWFASRNIPHVHLHEKRDNKDRWHGAEIQVVIEGNWTTYRVNVIGILGLHPGIAASALSICSVITIGWNLSSFVLTGALLLMQSKILHYMRQMAVITPYAQFLFKFISEASEYVVLLLFLFCASFSCRNFGSFNQTIELLLSIDDLILFWLFSHFPGTD